MKYFNYLRTFLPSNVSLHAQRTLDTNPEGRKDQKPVTLHEQLLELQAALRDLWERIVAALPKPRI